MNSNLVNQSESMSLVCPGLPLTRACYRYLTLLHNTDISDAVDDHNVGCRNKNVSLSYRLCLFREVRRSHIGSLTMIIVTDNRSSSRDILWENGHMLSELRVRPGTVPPSRMEVTVCMEDDHNPTTQTSISYINTDSYVHYKTRLNVDVERGSET